MRHYENMPARDLVTQDSNALVPTQRIPRSRFLGRKSRITSFNQGELIPIHLDELVPGDHVRYTIHPFVRINTPVFPFFSNFRVDTHAFVCPYRLVWDNWERFMGAQDNPADSINYTCPYVDSPASGFDVGSLWDHFGIPTVGQVAGGGTTRINAFFSRMYNLVYNTWYRNENLINSAVVDKDDGPDTYTDYVIRTRAKSHDYFTDALPWAQKFTAPTVPLGTRANVLGIGTDLALTGGGPYNSYQSDGTLHTPNPASYNGATGQTPAGVNWIMNQQVIGGNYYPDIYADLSTAAGISINTLRQAWMVQELLESNARAGTRYIEIIKEQFRTISPDYRLQRPEYIGGGQSPLNISPVAQTAPTTGLSVGALGGAGVSTAQHTASYAATEHCLVMILISVKSELAYQQGVHRMHRRQTRYDFYTPLLAGLGEQAILRNEIYHRGDSNDETVFGYAPRWDEYRQMYSDVTGRMRSTAANTIDPWHAAQKFTSAPTLNSAFNDDTAPMDRILAAGSTAGSNSMQFLADILIDRDITRPIPMYGIPATLGRM